jgi:hypothetical protein
MIFASAKRKSDCFSLMNQKVNNKSENGTDAGSESRSKACFDYTEQQGGKDREAGLKLTSHRSSSHPLIRSPFFDILTQYKRLAVNDERSSSVLTFQSDMTLTALRTIHINQLTN